MTGHVLRRLLTLIPLLLGVSVLIFALVHLAPGDPITAQFGVSTEGMDEEVLDRLRADLGLNDPLPVQYFRYVAGLLRGDLGTSIATKAPVSREITARLPATIQLAVAAMIVVLLLAFPLGILSALRRASWLDHLCMGGALLGVSMPSFWLGIMLILLFSLRLGWLPSMGRGKGLGGTLRSIVLPAITLGSGMTGLMTRIVRSSMLEVLSQDYMRTASAKGLSRTTVVVRHGLKNALIPVVTLLGVQFASLLGGVVITETIFAWPGIGRLTVTAIWRRDYPVIMGTVLMFAVIFLLVNLAVDIVYTLIDPRIRYD